MPVANLPSREVSGPPAGLRVLLAFALPMIGAFTVLGTYLGKEIVITAGWFALAVVGFLFIQPVIGVVIMTVAFLLAAYPSLLQALGFITINNLLGLCLLLLLALHLLETRDFSFLKVRQVKVLLVIGLLLLIGSFVADWQFPLLQQSVGKTKILDKSGAMGHNFVARLIYLIFFCVFVRTRGDVKVLFMAFMLALFAAVPSALWNWSQGTLLRGFRAAASVTSGANPNRLAMICCMEIACWWFWCQSRPGTFRRILGMACIGGSLLVILATGSRSGLMGLGCLLIAMQTGTKRFRVPTTHLAAAFVFGALAVASVVPPEAWERMIRFNPEKGEIGASSNRMREETLERAGEIWQDYPWFGVGLGNFREVSRQIYRDAYYRPPHNSYLWALSEGGIFVTLGYLVLFWITWKDLSIIRRLEHRDPEIGAVAGALRVVFILYFFFSGFADLWLNPLTYALLGLVITMRRYVENLPEPHLVAEPVMRAPMRLRLTKAVA